MDAHRSRGANRRCLEQQPRARRRTARATDPKRPKGEGEPKGGAGRGRAAERGRAAHASGQPERREPDPKGRTGRRSRTARTQQNFVFVLVPAKGRTEQKPQFCCGSPGGGRAELQRGPARLSSAPYGPERRPGRCPLFHLIQYPHNSCVWG